MTRKLLSELPTLPSDLTSTDLVHVRRGSLDYKITWTEFLADLQAQITYVDPFPLPASGNYYLPMRDAQYVNGGAVGSNKIRAYPIPIYQTITLSELGSMVSTIHASNNFQIGIYTHNTTTQRPGTLVGRTANISTGTAGEVTAAINGGNITLTPGLYWAAIITSSTSAAWVSHTGTSNTFAQFVGNSTLSTLFNSATDGFTCLDYTTGVTFAGGFTNLTSVSADNRGPTVNNFVLIAKRA